MEDTIKMCHQEMGWVEHVPHVGEKINVHWLLVVKPEGNRPLGRHGCRWRILLKCIIKK
jgi:hypothetical protein